MLHATMIVSRDFERRAKENPSVRSRQCPRLGSRSASSRLSRIRTINSAETRKLIAFTT
jgi:hypothetical protein